MFVFPLLEQKDYMLKILSFNDELYMEGYTSVEYSPSHKELKQNERMQKREKKKKKWRASSNLAEIISYKEDKAQN